MLIGPNDKTWRRLRTIQEAAFALSYLVFFLFFGALAPGDLHYVNRRSLIDAFVSALPTPLEPEREELHCPSYELFL